MKTSVSMVNSALQKKNKKNRKGFSLVELIVVLVIMAILAAALVPTLIAYIRQARQSTAKNDAAACVQAAQIVESSAFADANSKYTSESLGLTVTFTFNSGSAPTTTDTNNLYDIVEDLAEVDTTNGCEVTEITYDEKYVVETLAYNDGTTYVYYNDGTYGVGSTENAAKSDAGGVSNIDSDASSS